MRESHGGAGERWMGGACKHGFQYLIPAYQLLVYPMIGRFWQLTSTTSVAWLRTLRDEQKNMASLWNRPTTHILTIEQLSFWHEKRFFWKWAGTWGRGGGRGLWYLYRCLQAVPFALPAVFRSLALIFHYLPAIFTRLQWPRAWRRLVIMRSLQRNKALSSTCYYHWPEMGGPEL